MPWYFYLERASFPAGTSDLKIARKIRRFEIGVFLTQAEEAMRERKWEIVELERAIVDHEQSEQHVQSLWNSGNRILL
jgi:hypothetical protein